MLNTTLIALRLTVVTLAQEPPPQRLAAQNPAVAALMGRVVEASG